MRAGNFSTYMRSKELLTKLAIGLTICALGCGAFALASFFNTKTAYAAVPSIVDYQGRLENASGTLLGGLSGTSFDFKFSIWDAASGGSRLWPVSAPASTTLTVTNGVFSVGLGDTSVGFPALSLNFNSATPYYLEIDVWNATSSLFEAMNPRQAINAAGFAINAGTLNGFTQGTSSNNLLQLDASGSINLPGGQLRMINSASCAALPALGGGALCYDTSNNNLFVYNSASSSWVSLGGTSGGTETLQQAYALGNTITTTDARDLSFTLANTTTSANFLVNIASGSQSAFEVQYNGSNKLVVNSSSATFSLPVTITSVTSSLLKVTATGLITAASAGVDYMVPSNNLSDLTNTSTARTNIGFSGGLGITITATGTIRFTTSSISQFSNDVGYITSTPATVGTTSINQTLGPNFTFSLASSSNAFSISTSTNGQVTINLPNNVGAFTNDRGYITTSSITIGGIASNTFNVGTGLAINSAGTLSNIGVTSLTAGTGIALSNTTGSITVSGVATTSINGAFGPSFTFATSGIGLNITTSTGQVTFNFTNPGFVTAASSVTWTAAQTFTGGLTANSTTTLNSSTILGGIGNALLTTNGSGLISAYAGSSCPGNQFGTQISPTGTIICSTSPASAGTTTINGVVGPSFTFSLASSSNAFSITTSSGQVTINLPNNVGAFTNDRGYLTTSSITIGGIQSSTFGIGTGLAISSSGTLSNIGVTSLTAGTGISLSNTTGSITVSGVATTSINQTVGPSFTFSLASSSNAFSISTSTNGQVTINLPNNVGAFTNDRGYITTSSITIGGIQSSTFGVGTGLSITSTGTIQFTTTSISQFANDAGYVTSAASAATTTITVGGTTINGPAFTFASGTPINVTSSGTTITWSYNTSTALSLSGLYTFLGGVTANSTATFNSSTILSGVQNALVLTNASGLLSAYAGSSCSGGQFGTQISPTGTIICSTPAGSGNVSSATTTSNNFFPFWSGSNQLSATSSLQQSGLTLLQGGAFNASGTITQNGVAVLTTSSITIGGVVSSSFNIGTGLAISSSGTLANIGVTSLTAGTGIALSNTTGSITVSGVATTSINQTVGPSFTFSLASSSNAFSISTSTNGQVTINLPNNVGAFANDRGYITTSSINIGGVASNTFNIGAGLAISSSGTLANIGVTSLTAGTGIALTNTTGSVTVSGVATTSINGAFGPTLTFATSGIGLNITTSSGQLTFNWTNPGFVTAASSVTWTGLQTFTGGVTHNSTTTFQITNISTSTSAIQLGTSTIQNGNASGTWIAANVSSSVAGDWINFQVNSSTKFLVSGTGSALFAGTLNASGTITQGGIAVLTTSSINIGGIQSSTFGIGTGLAISSSGTLSNIGVTSLTAGTGISLSNTTGSITVSGVATTSINQTVGPSFTFSLASSSNAFSISTSTNGQVTINLPNNVGAFANDRGYLTTSSITIGGIASNTFNIGAGLAISSSGTLANIGVTSLTAGTGIALTNTTGSVTVSGVATTSINGAFGPTLTFATSGIGLNITTTTGQLTFNWTNPGFVTAASSVTWTGLQVFTGGVTHNSTTTFLITNISTSTSAIQLGTSTIQNGNASGTWIAANVSSSVAGDWINFQVNSSTKFYISGAGAVSSTGLTNTAVANALVLAGAGGIETTYSGTSCSGGQFGTQISPTGTIICSTPAGSGNVSSATTTSNNFFPFWSGSNQLSATSTVQQSGLTLLQGGAFNASGTITQNGVAVLTTSSITIGGVVSSSFNIGTGLTISSSGTIGFATTSISQFVNDVGYVTSTGGSSGLSTSSPWTTNYVPLIASGNQLTQSWISQSVNGIIIATGTGLQSWPLQTANGSLFQLGAMAIVSGNASGTYFGVNASSGFNGDFINFQINSSTAFRVASSGALTITATSTQAFAVQDGGGNNVFAIDTTQGAGNSGIDITAATGQTTHLLDFYSSGGAVLSGVDANGNLIIGASTTLSNAKLGVSGLPTQSATSALVLLGANQLIGGSNSGTIVAANLSSPYNGDFINFQVNSATKLLVSGAGNALFGGTLNVSGTITQNGTAVLTTSSITLGGVASSSFNLGTGLAISSSGTLANIGVTSLTAGTGISLSNTTGSITVSGVATTSINQTVGPSFTFSLASSSNAFSITTSTNGQVTINLPNNVGAFANDRGYITTSSINIGGVASNTFNIGTGLTISASGTIGFTTTSISQFKNDSAFVTAASSVTWTGLQTFTGGVTHNSTTTFLITNISTSTSAIQLGTSTIQNGNASGTWIAANVSSSVAGDWINFQVNSSTKFLVSGTGSALFAGTLNASGTITQGGFAVLTTSSITIGGVVSSSFNIGTGLVISSSGTIGFATTSISQFVNDAGYVTSTTGNSSTTIINGVAGPTFTFATSGIGLNITTTTGQLTFSWINPGFVTAASSVTWTGLQTFTGGVTHNSTTTFLITNISTSTSAIQLGTSTIQNGNASGTWIAANVSSSVAGDWINFQVNSSTKFLVSGTGSALFAGTLNASGTITQGGFALLTTSSINIGGVASNTFNIGAGLAISSSGTLANIGVTSLTAGTGIALTNTTGSITVSGVATTSINGAFGPTLTFATSGIGLNITTTTGQLTFSWINPGFVTAASSVTWTGLQTFTGGVTHNSTTTFLITNISTSTSAIQLGTSTIQNGNASGTWIAANVSSSVAGDWINFQVNSSTKFLVSGTGSALFAGTLNASGTITQGGFALLTTSSINIGGVASNTFNIGAGLAISSSGTLANIGVTSLTAGTGIALTNTTGSITVSGVATTSINGAFGPTLTFATSGIGLNITTTTGQLTFSWINPGFVTAASSVTWTGLQTFTGGVTHNSTTTFLITNISTSTSAIQLGTSTIQNGNASGTWIAANVSSSVAGDWINFQVNSSTKFLVSGTGSALFAGTLNASGTITQGGFALLTTSSINIGGVASNTFNIGTGLTISASGTIGFTTTSISQFKNDSAFVMAASSVTWTGLQTFNGGANYNSTTTFQITNISTSTSAIQLGTSTIQNGNSSGTWIAANVSSSVAGDWINFQVNSSTKFLVSGTGSALFAGTLNASGTITQGGFAVLTTSSIRIGGVASNTFNIGTGLTISASGTIGFTTTSISQFANDAGYVTSTSGGGGLASSSPWTANYVPLILNGNQLTQSWISQNINGIAISTGTGLASWPLQSATSSLFRLGSSTLLGGNVSGTYFGINASSGFNGDFLNFQVNSSSVFEVASSGALTITGTSTSALLVQDTAGNDVFVVDTTQTTANSGIDITAGTGQTSHLLDFYSSAGLVMSGFDSGANLIIGASSSLNGANITIATLPTESSSSASLVLGLNPLSGGSASGTVIASNPTSSFKGDFINFQVNSSTNFKVSASGSVFIGASSSPFSTSLLLIGSTTRIFSVENTGNIDLAPVATPPAPTVATSSIPSVASAFANATFFVKVTALDVAGGETVPGPETSIATGMTTSTLFITWPGVYGAASYRVYVGTSTGREGQFIATTVNSITVTSSTLSTANPPSSTVATASHFGNGLNYIGGGGTTSTLYIAGLVNASNTAPLVLFGTKAIANPSANGTYLGVNATNTFNGDFINFQVNGTSTFKVSSSGIVTINSTGTQAALLIQGFPAASNTASLLQIGGAIVSGSASGTLIGGNILASTTLGDIINFQEGGTPVFRVSNTGRVEIGPASSSAAFFGSTSTLTVCAQQNCTGSAGSSTNAVIWVASTNGATTNMSIAAHGVITGGLADVGEFIDVVGHDVDYGAGDVLTISKTGTGLFEKSQTAYDPDLAGAITVTAGLVAGGGGDHGASIIALAGRIPVKVTGKNGPIAIGDYITASDISGFGMKATHAGRVLGIAMESFAGNTVDATGSILTFINPHYEANFAGSASSSVPGFTITSVGNFDDIGTLSMLAGNASHVASTTNVTQSYADLVTAGLEVITPKVLTQSLSIANTASGTAIRFDALGNAVFNGTINANSISANSLQSPELTAIVANANALSSTVADLVSSSAFFASTTASLASTTAQLASTTTDISSTTADLANKIALIQNAIMTISSSTPTVNFQDLLNTATGTLSLNPPLRVAGGLQVDSISSTSGGATTFNNDVVFFGRPYLNSDSGGFALIPSGKQKVDVTFTNAYIDQPVVNVTMTLDNASTSDATAQTIFANGVSYLVTNKSTNGFTILLNKAAPTDIAFSWTAFAVNGAKTFTFIDQPASSTPTSTPPTPPDNASSTSSDASSTTSTSSSTTATSSSTIDVSSSTISVTSSTTTTASGATGTSGDTSSSTVSDVTSSSTTSEDTSGSTSSSTASSTNP
jgi:hypothetical protein